MTANSDISDSIIFKDTIIRNSTIWRSIIDEKCKIRNLELKKSLVGGHAKIQRGLRYQISFSKKKPESLAR